MCERKKIHSSLTASHGEVMNEHVDSKRQLKLMLYGDMITRFISIPNKLKTQSTESVIKSSTVARNNEHHSDEIRAESSNKHSLEMGITRSNHPLHHQAQIAAGSLMSQPPNSCNFCLCVECKHLERSFLTQHNDCWQRDCKENSKTQQHDSGGKNDTAGFHVNNSLKPWAQLYSLETHREMNGRARCIFCNINCTGHCCSPCSLVNQSVKFRRLLQFLEKCSESLIYYDEINAAVVKIKQVGLFT
jgi:hypothetical protein